MVRHLRLGVLLFSGLAGLFLFLDLAYGRSDTPTKKYAFLVGVDKYEKRGFPDLNYAERDVVELAKLLRAGGYEVVLLTGSTQKTEDRASKANIESRFKELLGRVNKNDLVLLAFAGHGEQIELKDKVQPFFCPLDAVFGEAASLVAINNIMAQLDKRGGSRNLVLIDACRNDPTPGRGARGIDGNRADALPEGTAVLFSCSRGQRAFETKNAGGGHGVFFHFVLEGLRGKAARDGSSDVPWDRLVTYVTENVNAHLDEMIPKTERGNLMQDPHEVKNLSGKAPVLLTKKDLGETKFALPKTLELDLGGGVKMQFVRIEPGKFRMGSPKNERDDLIKKHQHKADELDDEKDHDVEITKPFYLASYLVTQEQYERLLTKTPSYFSLSGGGKAKVKDLGDTRQFPVERVSWDEAAAFCQELMKQHGAQTPALLRQQNYRFALPTEAQWEYACRAGTTTPYHFGSNLNGQQANCDGNFPYPLDDKGPSLERTSKVGGYAPNSWGLYDMHGNVLEWCADYFDPKFYTNGIIKDPVNLKKPQPEQRVLRGGSWFSDSMSCRAAARYSRAPSYSGSSVGFRVVFRLE